MDLPLVTVIIPAYNMARYLPQAVDSALAQTGCTLEVIIVDDASTDDTLAVARSYTDPRVRVLTNDENRGPSFSRNRALEAACGTWIALLDADDWFAPGRLAWMLEVARREHADMVADDVYLIRDGEGMPFTTQFQTARQPMPRPLVLTPASFLASNREGFWCFRLGTTKPLMRRAFLQQHHIRYDERVRFCEDTRLYLQCLLHGARFVVEPEPFYYRRRHEGSITAGDIVQLLEKEWRASPTMLNDPLVRQDKALVEAIHRRTAELRRHLAFRRFQHAFQTESWRSVASLLTWDAFSFMVQRIYDRLKGKLYLLRNTSHMSSTHPFNTARLEPKRLSS